MKVVGINVEIFVEIMEVGNVSKDWIVHNDLDIGEGGMFINTWHKRYARHNISNF